MRKTIYTLNVPNGQYAPELCALTYPLIQRYANKIGADFHVIGERKFPDYPVTYEKLQIFDLAQRRGDDWSIYIDSDAVVHPDMFDPTNHLSGDTVAHNGRDMADTRWRYDRHFIRDGRHISSCNWFTVASSLCVDLWHPLEIPLSEALDHIHPTVAELNSPARITREHLIDDYTLSRNIAKFGLKFKTVRDIQSEMNDTGAYLWHVYEDIIEDTEVGSVPIGEIPAAHYVKDDKLYRRGKLSMMKEVLKRWNLSAETSKCSN